MGANDDIMNVAGRAPAGADAVGGRDTLLDGGRRLGTWQKRAPLDTAQPSDAWVKVDAPDAPPPGPQGPQADQRRRRRALLLAAALGALLIAGAAAAAAVLGARASRAATAARKGEEGGPGAAPTDATWSIKLYPSGANGLPRAKATLEAAAPRIASGGGGKGAGSSSGAGGADGASTFIVDVSQPAASTLDAWRAQVRSAPLALGPDSAYSFLFEGRSDAPNATARAVLHSQASGKPVMVREVALGRNWAPLSLRLVQPDAADGRGALYSFQIQLGNSKGAHQFKNLRILEEPLAAARDAVSPTLVAARTAEARTGEFRLAVADASGRPGAAARVNLTLLRHAFAFGAAIEPEVVRDEMGADAAQQYVQTFGANFWSITPENAFKWPNYEPAPGLYQASVALLRRDYFSIARNYSIRDVRGHTLEWGEPYRDFFITGKDVVPFWPLRGRDCAAYWAALEAHVRRDVRLFKGQFTSYDVLNELVEMPSMLRWCGLDTPESVSQVFQWAHEADPDAELCLNEWAVLEGSNWEGLLELARALLARGAPLNCLGAQAHLTSGRATPEMIWRRLDEITSLGLPVRITELSVSTDWRPDGPVCGLSEDEQARQLGDLVALFFSHPGVTGVTLWGFFDGHVWVKGGGIFRPDFTPKPAALALQDFWSRRHNSTVADAGTSPGRPVTWRGYYGRYAYELLDAAGRRRSGTFDLKPGGSHDVLIQV